MSEETRKRVLQTMREMNYRPTALRRTAAERQILTLGLVAGVPGNSLMMPGYYGAVVDAVLRAADELSHNVTLFTNSLMHTDTRRSLRVYCDGRCEGLIVLAPLCNSRLVRALHERGFPFVIVGDTGDRSDISCVDLDNVAANRRVTEYLIAQGHRRIAYIGGPEFVRSAEQRLEGYRQALVAQGITFTANRITRINGDHQGYDSTLHLMQHVPAERPTALLCWNDQTAFYALKALHELGIRVPEQVSVTGFDDITAEETDPPLTTVRQPYLEIGKRAVEIVLAHARSGVADPQRILFPGELIERATVAPPKEEG